MAFYESDWGPLTNDNGVIAGREINHKTGETRPSFDIFEKIKFMVLGCVVTLVVTTNISQNTIDSERARAVAANVARYEADPETGKVTFVYGVK